MRMSSLNSDTKKEMGEMSPCSRPHQKPGAEATSTTCGCSEAQPASSATQETERRMRTVWFMDNVMAEILIVVNRSEFRISALAELPIKSLGGK